MENARVMYLRPGNLFKDFAIQHSMEELSDAGRPIMKYVDDTEMLSGCLAEASDEDRNNHSIQDHVVTHTIVQSGRPKAKRTDRLVMGERVFYIVDVDDMGALGISTIYYAEERMDVR